MIYIVVNAVPILLAALAGVAFGALWLRLFGGGDLRPSRGLLATAFVAEAWFAAILAGALILAPSKAGVWTMAIGSAVVIWIGFVVPVLVVTLCAGRVAARRVLLACAHWLGVMLVQVAVLQSIGLSKPG